MLVIVSTYRARVGEEDAIIALHEDWQQQQPRAKGYLSGELLRNVNHSRQFIAIMRFESQGSAQAWTSDPEQQVWYQRLSSLTERQPIHIQHTCEWPLPTQTR